MFSAGPSASAQALRHTQDRPILPNPNDTASEPVLPCAHTPRERMGLRRAGPPEALAAVFDYIAGGAEDEVTLRRNRVV